MKQERTPQQTIDALRDVVMRQRTVLNRKCKDLEFYQKQYDGAMKLYNLASDNMDELSKQVTRLEKLFQDRYVATRIAVFFMLNAIREGYKFHDQEAESIFYQFCDEVGIDKTDRSSCFANQVELSK